MPSHSQYVAIVGAGIAGCAAAIFLGRAGARVALIERDRDPAGYKKLCTHFIQASATPTLERLGLASAIEEAAVCETMWKSSRDGDGLWRPRNGRFVGLPLGTTFGA